MKRQNKTKQKCKVDMLNLLYLNLIGFHDLLIQSLKNN